MAKILELKSVLLITFYINFVQSLSFENCENVHGRNLSQLNGVWQAHYQKSNDDNAVYTLNICSGLSQSIGCASGSAVCQNISGNFTSFGDLDKPPSIVSANSTSVGFYLEYNTTQLCHSDGQNEYFFRSSITFECGRTLGSPVVISADNCSVDFLWETSYACLSHATEVRCDAFDNHGKKRDLEVLILQRGGHFVKDPSHPQTGTDGVYINVCRNIYENSKPGCPANAAACLIKNNHGYMLGEITKGVNITENRLFLEYLAPPGSDVPSECSGFTPSVRVNFVCPGSGRGGSKPPIVTSSINCQYNIEWWTEAACPVDMLTSSNCGLNVQNHNVELDLTPLRKENGHHYEIPGHNSDGNKYLLNICASTDVPCGDALSKHNAVCQISSVDPSDSGHIAGNENAHVVKYVDGQLSLTYKKGDRCSDGFRRSSVILFHCNKTAGIGSPTFNHEVHCIYYFDWETSYACINTPTCHVTDDAGQTYDLSTLTRSGNGVTNWQVLNGQTSETQSQVFINICGELLDSDQTRQCTNGSSVCAIASGSQTSYGSFSSSTLTRQANKLKLTYNGGDGCENGKRRKTTIIFYCKMGDLESSPVYKYSTTDNCELVLTWHTAAACPLKSVHGTNCMISDEESGLTFDLKRLAKSESEAYKVSTGSYDYYLNICDDVPTSVCSSPHHDHPAACQVEHRGSNRTFILGETSQSLLYYNGFVKLLYTNGDRYGDHIHNRSAQISFLCDPKAGAGHPQFVTEGNHTYVFNWYTSYVCPFASTQCMVTGPDGAQYDLSSLAKSEDDQDANWSVLGEEVSGQGRRKYYLNVCRPVNEVQSSTNRDIGCDALAGACATMITSSGKESINVSNLGRPISAPQIERKGHLILKYTGGENCTGNGVTKPFQTHIHLSCQKGALSSSPRFLERADCTVSFEWATEAACAITESEGVFNNSMCEVKSPNSHYIFNLEPLRHKSNNPYVIAGQSEAVYELNVCGTVDDCKTQGDNKSLFAGCKKTGSNYTERMNHAAPAYSDDGHLFISHRSYGRDEGTRNFLHYEITFVCNRSVAKGEPTFNGVDGDRTRFDFQTSLACEPQAVDCLVADNFGNQYDLTSLSTSVHPWTAIDSARSRSFYLSVCRPLPPVSECQGSASGACLVENGNGTNLGMVQSNPQAVSNGGQGSAVTISYMGGDICTSDHTRRYSTRILFQCADQQGAPPVLQNDNSDPCEFYFVWQTPSACPIKKSTSKQHCSVVDPLYHMTFNLSTLHTQQGYHVHTDGEWDYDFNVCGKLNGGSKDCKDSGACQVSHTTPTTNMHDAGKPNTTLSYEDGVVTLTYLFGEPCHQKKYNRSTTFRFTCHHSQNTQPTYINESADCTYIFDWPTPKVCPPINIVECIAQGSDGAQYDLSPLSLAHRNHMAAARGEAGRTFYLNICRSMLHTPGVTCPPNSAACFKTDDNKFYSIGEVSNGPSYENGRLTLTYGNGNACIADKTRNYTTTVHFQCDPSAALDSVPLLTSDPDSCHVELLWTTRAACALSNQTAPSAQPCTAVNPRSKHMFNLTSLASDSSYNVSTEDGRLFHLNVCQPVKDSNCPSNTGVCVTRGNGHWSAGEASSPLVYQEGALSLHYQHGAACIGHGQYNHSTVISFICHRNTSSSIQLPHSPASKPVFVSDDPSTCTHYFSWHTNLACEVQSPCAVVNNTNVHRPKLIDLSPLISESGHYSVLSDTAGQKAAYYINVCRPLEPIKGVSCPPGSAACEITPGQQAKSLGYIDAMEDYLTYDVHTSTATLRYASSRSCETASNPNVTVSTKIIFSCLRGAGSGSALPRLTTVTSDCVYVFEWGTELLCSPDSAPSAPTCSFHDTITGSTYDLSKLKPVEINDRSGKFTINPCSNGNGFPGIAECKDSVACFQSKTDNHYASLGKASTREISSGAVLKSPVQMIFQNGTACPSAHEQKYLHIVFRCNNHPSAEASNKVQLYYDSREQCKYTLSWPTPHVCPLPSKSCLVVDPNTGSSYDLSLLSSLSRSWTFKDDKGNQYYVNICRSLPHKESVTKDCNEDATICMISKTDKKAHSFGILRSQVMEVLPSSKVILRYSGGDRKLCNDEEMSASTEINFVCDPSISGLPQFKELSHDKCVLRVTWKTRIACADESKKVTLNNGTFIDPKSGVTVDLSPLMNRTWITEGDLRSDENGPRVYRYAISLAGQLDTTTLKSSVYRKCSGHTAVCQYSSHPDFARKIAETAPAPPSYVMTDESLEINFTSTDKCGKDPNKTSHVYISLRCSQYSGIGNPTFVYESIECGYFFQWYTNIMCTRDHILIPTPAVSHSTHSSSKDGDVVVGHEVLEPHKNAAAVVTGIFIALTVICILYFALRNPESRIKAKRVARKAFCCAGSQEPAYRYIRSDEMNNEGTSLFDDDDDGVLREETSLFSSASKSKSSYRSGTGQVDILPIGGAMDSDNENELFDIPKVKVDSGRTKKKKAGTRKQTKKAKGSSNHSKTAESEDLLSLIPDSNTGRAPGVGGEKVESYHDDDDIDMLDA